MGYLPLTGLFLAIFIFPGTRLQAQNSAPERGSMAALIRAELAAHPEAHISDIYKFVYQGSFGVGHLIRDRESAAAYLRQEIDGLGPAGADEPLLVPCSPDGTQYRLNLRPFVAGEHETESLVDAMVESAEMHGHDTSAFLARWEETGSIIEDAAPALFRAYGEFTNRVKSEGYPAVHHSQAYREAYRPAYRVLHITALETHFPSILPNRER